MISTPHSSRNPLLAIFALGLLVTGTVFGEESAEVRDANATATVAASEAAVEGRVLGPDDPVAAATVYAYEVVSNSLEKVLADREGRFLFRALPAGMYKLIAYKEGLAPTIALLLRPKPDARQVVEIKMREQETAEVRQTEDYWTVRSRIPPDVLRDIQSQPLLREVLEPEMRLAGLAGVEGAMIASSGVERFGDAIGDAHWTGADVDLRGMFHGLEVELSGQYRQLASTAGTGAGMLLPDGRMQAVALAVDTKSRSTLSVASSTSELPSLQQGAVLPVDREHYQLRWSRRTGESGSSGIAAKYTQENNFHRTGWLDPLAVPAASRTWDLEGFYDGELSDTTSLRAGLSYRQRSALPSFDQQDPLDEETLGAFGLMDSRIASRVMVEYGLYSTVHDGGWSLMPHGGVMVDLGGDWQARSTFAQRVDRPEPPVYPRFYTAFYADQTTCREIGEACYEVFVSRGEGDDSISIGALHREYAETLRLYFSPDVFDRLEGLFVVDGDEVPEVQLSLVRRIAPKVLAKLESNFAEGGGGIFYATDEAAYENEVRYLITSLDTRFQHTATGVFLAFHHLEQALQPLDHAEDSAAVEMQRLQLMLTQDLNVLADLASNWAVRLNLELSRGSTPYTLTADNELFKKLTGGISVSF